MPLIKTVSPEQAQGGVKDAYSFFLKMGPVVPLPFQMLSASEPLLKIQGQGLKYFTAGQKRLSFALLAHIRYLVAAGMNYNYCEQFNGGLLSTLGGIEEEKLEAARSDPDKAELPDKEKALLKFVLRVVSEPDSITQKDVDDLVALGWTDQDILEAAYHGTGMVAHGLMFKAFKMDQ